MYKYFSLCENCKSFLPRLLALRALRVIYIHVRDAPAFPFSEQVPSNKFAIHAGRDTSTLHCMCKYNFHER